MIVSVSDVPRGEVQVLFGHQKQWSPPLGSGLPWALKVFSHRPIYPAMIYCFVENLSKGDMVF
jgi:hypothetical protein